MFIFMTLRPGKLSLENDIMTRAVESRRWKKLTENIGKTTKYGLSLLLFNVTLLIRMYSQTSTSDRS